MEIGKSFNDINSYNNEMSKVMKDKLFFLDEIDDIDSISTIVDFGCADGRMVAQLLKRMNRNCNIIGYDISETMIQFARTNFPYDTDRVIFTNKWNVVNDEVKSSNGKTMIILSSVIHEVFSYQNPDNPDTDIEEFWRRVFGTGFNYIIIRDMMPSFDIRRVTKADDLKLVRSDEKLKKYVRSFEERWGSMEENLNFVHFLLKHKWTINWEREVNENYFPLYIDAFIRFVGKSGYNISYLKRFCPLKSVVKERFGITMTDDTHVKMILKK